jgi:hypothetical protein
VQTFSLPTLLLFLRRTVIVISLIIRAFIEKPSAKREASGRLRLKNLTRGSRQTTLVANSCSEDLYVAEMS